MKEETFRFWIVILLAVFVIGFLGISFRFSGNGRYVKYDGSNGNLVIDTRTGTVDAVKRLR
jgi:hypothetical protein